MADTHNLDATITAALAEILAEAGQAPRSFTAADMLVEGAGLDSLHLALLVVRLEDQFGIDPFREGDVALRTFGDLIAAYKNALEARGAG